MNAPAIRPTTTQRVRAFLDAQGVDLKPWSGLDETYGELYALLNARRDDQSFWGPLADLLRDVVGQALDGESRLPAPDAELLASWDIDELIRDLRKALPGDEILADHQTLTRFTTGLHAAVLGGFLVLGMAAVGCTPDEDSTPDAGGDADQIEAADGDADGDADEDADVDGDAEGDAECDLENSSVLGEILAESRIPEGAKQELCSCFASLNESWVGGLETLFATAAPAEIARILGLMADCCVQTPENLDSDFEDAEEAFLDGDLCGGVPVYRGVSFPD